MQLIEYTEKYHITADLTWNWDEKGFLIGQASITQRIMSLEALQSGRITHASQDGSREFISLLACISASGAFLPPALIYKGEHLQDSWLEDLHEGEEGFFTSSSKGWSSDVLGYSWLVEVFDRCTKKLLRLRQRKRLLIVDGHSSHVNMKFLTKCDDLNILVMILPPHSTHRLQPLDVSLFSPLATYYTEGLNHLMFNSLGMVSMSKRMFWTVFRSAWQNAFTSENIRSAFFKTGIFPLNPSLMLDQIIKKPASFIKTEVFQVSTPMTNLEVRRVHKAYAQHPTFLLLEKILNANERLASEHSIDQHIIRGLTEALKMEKKRRKRGARLNLLGEKDDGPQFFSPSKVQAAKDFQTSKEEEKLKKQEDIAEKRAQTVINKALKEKAKVDRSLLAAEKRRLKKEAMEAKAVEKQAQNELKMVAFRPRQLIVKLKMPTRDLEKMKNDQWEVIDDEDEENGGEEKNEAILITSRGRRVRPPKFHGD